MMNLSGFIVCFLWIKLSKVIYDFSDKNITLLQLPFSFCAYTVKRKSGLARLLFHRRKLFLRQSESFGFQSERGASGYAEQLAATLYRLALDVVVVKKELFVRVRHIHYKMPYLEHPRTSEWNVPEQLEILSRTAPKFLLVTLGVDQLFIQCVPF